MKSLVSVTTFKACFKARTKAQRAGQPALLPVAFCYISCFGDVSVKFKIQRLSRGLGKRKNNLPYWSFFSLDYAVTALFLITAPSFRTEPESPVSSMQLSAPGVSIPALCQLLFFLTIGSRKKVTSLLAHIQLCLIDSYTVVKELFATILFWWRTRF